MKRSLRVPTSAFMTAALMCAAAPGAYANDGAQVQVPSLEVRARIASMEQVNVTAEKSINPDVPAPSEGVAQLLAELEEIEAQANAESTDD